MEQIELLLECLNLSQIEELFLSVESVARLSNEKKYDQLLEILAKERSHRIQLEQNSKNK